MKRVFILSVLIMMFIGASAYEFSYTNKFTVKEIKDGKEIEVEYENTLYYAKNEDGSTVSVVAGPEQYVFPITEIPKTVKYKGKSYKVTVIGSSAFSGSALGRCVTIPSTVTEIETYAFSQCDVDSVAFSKGLKTIADGAFAGCTLTSVYLPEGVTSIGENSFAWAHISPGGNIRVVSLPKSLTDIGSGAFGEQANLTNVKLPSGLTEIKDRTFAYCRSLNTIQLPKTLVRIGDGAFDSSGITDITFPSSLKEIGGAAFYNANLQKVTIPNSVEKIGVEGDVRYGVFEYNYNLQSCTLSANMKKIPAKAFYGCHKLAKVTIPVGITKIGNNAFAYCEMLSSITLPEGLTDLDYGVFDHSGIKTIKLPSTLSYLGDGMFYGCVNMSSFTIPTTIKEIVGNAFACCSNLRSVSIPESVTSIGRGAFSGSGLREVIIPASITELSKGVFGDCEDLKKVILPENLTVIGEGCFYDCEALAEITIPKTLTTIYGDAFNGCIALKDITFPSTLESIGAWVFTGCTNLKALHINCAIPPVGNNHYGYKGIIENDNKCVLYVPKGSKTTYENTEGYMNFLEIKEEDVDCTIYYQVVAKVNAGKGRVLVNGAYDSSGKYKAAKKTNVVLTFEASEGYQLGGLTVNGTDMFAKVKSNKLTLSSIVANTTVEATFAQKPTAITFANASESVLLGKTKTLKATITPEDAVSKTITWTSSNTAVATVSTKGVVTAKSIGSAVITAKTSNGLTAKCKVTVKNPVTSITLSDATASIWPGKTKTLTAKIAPTDAGKNVTWSSSNTSVATVSSSGVVTAKAKGTATITCKAADGSGVKATCTVTVKQPVTAIELSATTATLWVGKTKTLTATATPTTASNTAVKWTSSNTSVATVSSKGVVSAKGKGTCTITCTAADGYGTKATCKVTVKQQVTSIDMGIETLTIACGTTKTITPIVNPSNANVKTLTWKSKNTKVATVTSEGVVKAVALGTTQITCTATDDFKKSATITVNVVPVSITDSKPTIAEGTYGAGCISYTRTLTAGKYAAFCLPYDVNLNDYTEEFSKVFVPMGMTLLKSNGTLAVVFKNVSLTETIRAGQPFVVLAAKTGSVSIVNDAKKTFTTLTQPEPTTLDVYNWNGSNYFLSFNPDIKVKIGGCYGKLSGLDSEKYYTVSTSGTMNKATSVSPYRIYVYKDDNNSKAKVTEVIFSFDEDEMATGVENITNEQKDDGKIYNINGQRINKSNAQKGIYIINGKKYAK